MLGRIPYETLKRGAIYGAVLSVTGSSILYYLLQSGLASPPSFLPISTHPLSLPSLPSLPFFLPPAGNLASGQYYQLAVEALRRDEHACRLLGEPLRFQALRLGDKQNVINTEHAQVKSMRM